MQIFSTISQIVHLAESRGARDIAVLAIELERELTRILAKLVEIKLMLDDLLEVQLGLQEHQASLTKIEHDIIDVLRNAPNRCMTIEELLSKLNAYTNATSIMALKKLKKLKIVDIDIDIDAGGRAITKICLRTLARV